MKKHQWLVGFIALGAIIALVIWGRRRIHFDFAVFREQLAQADWRLIAAGIACIYVGYLFRSARWAMLLRHTKKVGLFTLTGTQVIGFTAVALIGRVADPVRPYLVAKRTRLPLGTQIAVYIVERLFDFGAMAVIVSLALLWVPYPFAVSSHPGVLSRMFAPFLHHHPALAMFLTRFGALLITLAAALVLVAVRLSGESIAAFFERSWGGFGGGLGHAIGHKVRTFHSGLDSIRSFSDFGIAASLSLVMWALIALSYLVTVHAFTASPALAHLSIPQCVLLLIVSGSGSVLQLPVLGWFSQIAIVAAALSGLFHASPEAATACGATLLIVSFLSIVPVGLAWAQFENVSLRRITVESEHAEEEFEAQDGVDAGATP